MMDIPAADVCSSLAQEIRLVMAGDGDSAHIVALVDSLCNAPSYRPIDALALTAVARKLLCGMGEGEDMAVLAYVFDLIDRAVVTLEHETGYSAASFTGEVGTLN